MVHVMQSEENAKEIWRNSLNYVTFKMLQESCTKPPTYLDRGGKITLQLLLSSLVMLQKCPQKALSL